MDRIERSAAVDVVKQWFPNGTVNDPKRPAGAGIIDDLNALPPARFTRDDVEKAARKLAPHLEGGREFDQMPPTRIELRKWSREGMCSTNDATQDDALEAATAALSAIGEVEP